MREPRGEGVVGSHGSETPVQPGPQAALLPTHTPSRADTICYSQGTWPWSRGQCQRPLRLLGWKNWGAESWIISPSELHQALGHPGGPPLLLPPGQGLGHPEISQGKGKAELAASRLPSGPCTFPP